MNALLLLLILVVCLSSASTAPLRAPSLVKRRWRGKTPSVDLNAGEFLVAQADTVSPVATIHDSTVALEKSGGRTAIIAKILGYMVGIGAMCLYVPIIGSLISSKDSSGYSVSTWVLNVLGSMLAIAYPIKKSFPVSTYFEMISGLVQGVLILGLICLYQGLGVPYLQGMVPLLGLFATFVAYDKLSDRVLQSLQVAAIIVCTYANIPQIVLTFQQRRASWSAITAGLSTIGCIIRIFTTLQLTKDKLTLLGYSLGLTTNVILLSQIVWYNHICKQ
eukprot:gene9703-11408_t